MHATNSYVTIYGVIISGSLRWLSSSSRLLWTRFKNSKFRNKDN